MTGSKRTKAEQMAIAEKSRADYRKARIARLSNHTFDTDLPAPDLTPGAIIDTGDNTLNKDYLKAPLDFILEAWENRPEFIGEYNTIELQLAHAIPAAETDYRTFRELEIDYTETFPIKRLSIPKAELADDGPYSFRIHVILVNNERPYSDPLEFICDSTPPWGEDEPAGLADLPTVLITDQYLSENGDKVTGKIPNYDFQLGDKLYVYLDNKVPEDPPTQPPVISESVTGQGHVVTLKGEWFRELGDGKAYIIYVLIDKATNRSRLSHIANLDVVLGKLPTGFQPPVVPLADGVPDTVIDIKDAIEGVEVHIPEFQNGKSTDTIEVTWGATVLPPELIGTTPFPIPIYVHPRVLWTEWDKSTAKKPTNVSYRLLRGGVEVGTEKISIDVDFTYIGPPRPDPDPSWPDPINYKLLPPDVIGTGPAPELNKLVRSDGGLPANLTFKMYAPLADKEEITFYWGEELVSGITMQLDGTEVSGDDYTVQIPWSYIEKVGNGNVPVHYEISSPDTPNFQHSIPRMVIVDAFTFIPVKPTFVGRDEEVGWLNCTSLYADPDSPHKDEPAFRVQVPDLTEYGLKVGDTVTLEWIAIAGRDPATEVPVPGAEMKVDITLDAVDNKPTGFLWYITPYDEKILPTYNPPAYSSARGRIRYSYQLTPGGEIFTSATEEAFVGVFWANSSCPIPPSRKR